MTAATSAVVLGRANPRSETRKLILDASDMVDDPIPPLLGRAPTMIMGDRDGSRVANQPHAL